MADKYLPLPKSGRGYKPEDFILPIVLMLNGGDRAIEDIRKIKVDEGLKKELLSINRYPQVTPFMPVDEGEELEGLEQLNRFYLHKQLRRKREIKDYSLDAACHLFSVHLIKPPTHGVAQKVVAIHVI